MSRDANDVREPARCFLQPPPGEPPSMYTTYTKEDKGLLLLELPKNFETKRYFIGLTIASGQVFAGLQAGDFYVQWREYNGRLALIEPNVRIRSGGDNESKDSVNRLFTGRVMLDAPIITLSPRGGPVIDGRHRSAAGRPGGSRSWSYSGLAPQLQSK